MTIKRSDIIDDDALRVPLILAENLEKAAEAAKRLREASKEKMNPAADQDASRSKKIIEELTLEQQELEKIQKQISVVTARSTEEYRKQEKALQELKKSVKDKNGISAEEAKIVNAQTSSLHKLEQALKKNREEFAKLTSEEQRNSKEGKKLLDVIKQQDKDVKKLRASMGQMNAEVGNYKEAIVSALGPLGQFTGFINPLSSSLSGASSALGNAARASTVLGTAMRAIPIFLIITAITSLISYFKGTEEGAQKLRIAMAYVQGVFEAFMDILEDIGKFLSELTFEKITQGFKDIGNAVKDFVIERFKLLISAVKNVGEVFVSLWNKDFKGAAKQAKQALIDLARATNPVVMAAELIKKGYDSASESFQQFFAKVWYNTQALVILQKAENKLIQDRREFLVEEAILQRKIAEGREAAANNLLDDEKTLQILRQVQKDVNTLEARRLDLKSRELLIAKERLKINGDEESDLDHIAQLERELIEIQTERAASQRKLTAQISALELKIIKDRVKAEEKALKDAYEGRKNEAIKAIEAEKQLMQKQIDQQKLLALDGVQTRQEAEDYILSIQKNTATKIVQVQIDQYRKILQAQIDYAEKAVLVENLTEEEKVEICRQSAEERLAIEEKLQQLSSELIDAEFQNIIEGGEKLENEWEGIITRVQENCQMFAESMGSLFGSLTANRLDDIEKESKALDEQMKHQLESVGENETAKHNIQESFEARQEVLERKKIQQQRKAAIFDKFVSATQAAIATSLAVTKLLATPPLAIAAGVAGAIQVAAILARQIPQYAEGTDNHPGGPAIVGELGRELIQTPDQGFHFTPNGPTMMNLPAGTKVFPHTDPLTKIALSTLPIPDRSVTKGSQDHYSMMRKMEELNYTIKNKKEVHINWSKKGLEAAILNGHTVTKLLNGLYK